jgi:hypothetical protein
MCCGSTATKSITLSEKWPERKMSCTVVLSWCYLDCARGLGLIKRIHYKPFSRNGDAGNANNFQICYLKLNWIARIKFKCCGVATRAKTVE